MLNIQQVQTLMSSVQNTATQAIQASHAANQACVQAVQLSARLNEILVSQALSAPQIPVQYAPTGWVPQSVNLAGSQFPTM